jgi:flagellar basal body-associated protein FliL
MLTRQQKKRKDRKFYKAVVWILQITFVVLCLTAMVSITIIGLIG